MRAGERTEERDELEGVSERDQGLRGDARRPWRCGGSRRWSGKQDVAEAASAPVGHAPVPTGARRKATGGGGSGDGLGRTGAGPAGYRVSAR